MESVLKDQLSIVKETNEEMLSYFQAIYITKLESLQQLKSEQFEIEVKIEELEKTKQLYAFKSNDSKSIFSPLSSNTSTEHERSRVIDMQLQDLQGAKTALNSRIASLEQELASIQDKLSMLGKSSSALKQMSSNTEATEQEEQVASEDFVFLAEDKDDINHGYNILMLEEFHNTQLAHILSHFVKSPLTNNQNKLEVVGWLLNSDIDRARVTLKDMQTNTEEMLTCVEDIISRLQHPIDMKQPVWMVLDDFITRYRELHPECVIEADKDCPETDISIPPIVMVTFMQIMTEIFENVFKHSNANKITAKIIISNRLIDVFINDNGVGIQDNYLRTSKWYSGLHRVHEAIYLLDGKINIQGDLISGTNVRFSFPIDQRTVKNV